MRVSGRQIINTRSLVYTQSIAGRILRELLILIPGSGGWCWVAWDTDGKEAATCTPFCKVRGLKYMTLLPTKNWK